MTLRRSALACLSISICLTSSAAPIPNDAATKNAALEKSFLFLALQDTNSALFGVLPMARTPAKELVPFLRGKLKPLQLTEDRAMQLLSDLDSEDTKVAEAAYVELGYFDLRLAMNPRKAFEIVPQGLARQRLAACLLDEPRLDTFAWCKLDFHGSASRNKDGTVRFETLLSVENMPGKPAGFKSYCDEWQGGGKMSRRVPFAVAELDPPIWKRLSRAIVLLEHLGTADARKLIETMADGHPDATPTIAAKAALRRLDGPPLKPNFDTIWNDLLKHDETAIAGVLTMLKHPAEATTAIKDRIRPVQLTEERCRGLVLALGDSDVKKWRAAWDELGYHDPRLVFDLPKLMELVPEGIARTRLAEQLCDEEPDSMKGLTLELGKHDNGISFFKSEKWSRLVEADCKRLRIAGWERARAAVRILEAIGTPEAANVIEAIAAGHPKAVPTVTALRILELKKVERAPKQP